MRLGKKVFLCDMWLQLGLSGGTEVVNEAAINVLSLFCGGGGLDLGFSAAGFNIKASVDVDPFSCQTILLNRKKRKWLDDGKVICQDIKTLSVKQLLSHAKLRKGDVDVLIGGPPCQAFSVFGQRRGLTDARGTLLWDYLRYLEEIKPRTFVFENVPGLKTIHGGSLFEELLVKLSLDGVYEVCANEYELADFGVPQFRKRVIITGQRVGEKIGRLESTHANQTFFNGHLPYNNAGSALKGMPKPGPQSGLANHIGRDHSDRIIKRYRELKPGERDHFTRINKLDTERPSFTIIVGSDAGGGKGHVHPIEPREVTPRESARLQSFPDWWEFAGTGRHVIRQVGNAVPPLFAAVLATHIGKRVFGKSSSSSAQLMKRLGVGFLLPNAN